MSASSGAKRDGAKSEVDTVRGQPVEEAEKNLSRHSTQDSSPPVDEQWRTNVPEANEIKEGKKI